jgi:hypothetical protein
MHHKSRVESLRSNFVDQGLCQPYHRLLNMTTFKIKLLQTNIEKQAISRCRSDRCDWCDFRCCRWRRCPLNVRRLRHSVSSCRRTEKVNGNEMKRLSASYNRHGD